MSGYLGIDMGGTATRFALVDRDGHLLRRGEAGGASGHLFAEAARRQFTAAIAEIASALGGDSIDGIEAGVTGFGPESNETAIAILTAALGTPQPGIKLRQDIELAHRLIFAPGGGHLISSGSGSIGVHITANGEMVRVGGRGMLIDDAGSGVWIGLRAIDAVYRDIDLHGRPEKSALLAQNLFDAIGSTDWDAVRGFVYQGERGQIGTLARAVAAAADAGCPVAGDLMARAGVELARLASALIGRCGSLPVAVIGRVPKLSPLIAAAFEAELPGIAVSYPEVDVALEAARAAASADRQFTLAKDAPDRA